MKRRFAAIIFVLTIAGNIWAGVCHCVDMGGNSVSSCCKREKIQGTAMSAQPCCEELCGDEGFVTALIWAAIRSQAAANARRYRAPR